MTRDRDESYVKAAQVASGRHQKFLSAWESLQRELRKASASLSRTAGRTVHLRVVTPGKSSIGCPIEQKHQFEQHHTIVLRWERQVVYTLCGLHSDPRGFPFMFISPNQHFGWRVPGSNMCQSFERADVEDDISKALSLALADQGVGKVLHDIRNKVASGKSSS